MYYMRKKLALSILVSLLSAPAFATVVHNLESPKILLGMSFLGQVDMSQTSGLMVLKHRN